MSVFQNFCMQNVCMSECLYVRISVCRMSVFQNFCMQNVCMSECLYVRMSVCQDVCMSEWRYVWVSGCLYVRIAVCRDVCMPRCLFALNRLKTILSKFSLIFNDVWGCPPPLILTNLSSPPLTICLPPTV